MIPRRLKGEPRAKQVRLSQDVYEAIGAEGRGIRDTIDQILRRKYGLPAMPLPAEPVKKQPKKR